MCPESAGSKFNELQEHVLTVIGEFYDESMAEREHRIEWNRVSFITESLILTEAQEDELKSETPQQIYDFLKKNIIGVIGLDENSYAVQYNVGGISVSFQFDKPIKAMKSISNCEKEIGLDEFETIFGRNCNDDFVLFIVWYSKEDGTEIGVPGRQTLTEIASTLNEIGTKEHIKLNF